jgi:CDP-6-deoxy-D-xylo-4-hexulose-3-dehydrase
MKGADKLMSRALFLGTYPGLTQGMIDYEIEIINEFLNKV